MATSKFKKDALELARSGSRVMPRAPGDGSRSGGAWFGAPPPRPTRPLCDRDRVRLEEMSAKLATINAGVQRLQARADLRERESNRRAIAETKQQISKLERDIRAGRWTRAAKRSGR